MEAIRADVWGIDPYVPGKTVAEVKAQLLGLERVVKLGSNECADPPLPGVVEAVARAAADCNRYPDPGTVELRAALAELHGVTPTQILPGNGADELILLLAQATLGPGRSVVFATPGFPTYGVGAAAAGARAIAVPMPTDRLDVDALLAAVDETTALVCLANPNNPTGALAAADDVRRLAARLPEHAILLLDEAYVEYVDPALRFDGTQLVREGAERVCVLRTFSKAYALAGLRVGYAVADERIASALNRVRSIFNVSAPAQAAALAALQAHQLVERRARRIRAARPRLAALLAAAGLEPRPSQGNFVYAEAADAAAADRLADALLREGVIVRPMGGFGAPHGIRVTVGDDDELAFLRQALAAVAEPARSAG